MMNKHIGIKKYVSPREKELTPEEKHVREVAYALKRPEIWAVKEAVEAMTPHIPTSSILIPIPDSKGSTKVNKILANALAKHTRSMVYDVLSRNAEVPSSHRRRRKGLPGLSPDEHGFEGSLPEKYKNKKVLFVDNVLTTNSTF